MFLGVAAKNQATTVILRGLIVMGLCWVIGFAVGKVAQRTVRENIEAYKQAHEIPEDALPEDEMSDEVDADEDQALAIVETPEEPAETGQSARPAA